MQHKAAVDRMGGLIKRQARAHGGGEGVHPLRLQVQMRHRAQRLHFHRTAQRDIVGAAAGNLLRRRAAGRQRVVQVDIDFQAFRADGNLFHFLCGGAFDGMEKIIEQRLNKKTIGFGADIQSKKERDTTSVLKQVQPHDLLKFGIIPELVGRLPVITTLNALDKGQLVRILTEPKNALVKQYQKLLEYDMVELDFDTQALEAAADRAIERGIGARGLRAVLEEVMTPLMYEVPSDPTITRVTITAESVKEHVSPAGEHDPDRTQRPRLGGAALHAEQGGVSPKGNVS